MYNTERPHSALEDAIPTEAYDKGLLMEMQVEPRPSAGSTIPARCAKQDSGGMTDHPEYTLTQPPNCPRKWDHIIVPNRPWKAHGFVTWSQKSGGLL